MATEPTPRWHALASDPRHIAYAVRTAARMAVKCRRDEWADEFVSESFVLVCEAARDFGDGPTDEFPRFLNRAVARGCSSLNRNLRPSGYRRWACREWPSTVRIVRGGNDSHRDSSNRDNDESSIPERPTAHAPDWEFRHLELVESLARRLPRGHARVFRAWCSPERPTVRDVATRLGISPARVARALDDAHSMLRDRFPAGIDH